jgi:hypothetical protein
MYLRGQESLSTRSLVPTQESIVGVAIKTVSIMLIYTRTHEQQTLKEHCRLVTVPQRTEDLNLPGKMPDL